MPANESVKHHINPRHLLARFENDGGGLTVLRRSPWVVLRNQAPESVGYIKRHNSRRNPDGSWSDEGERILANMDAAGAAEIDEAIRFGIDADAESHPRLLDMALEHRANLQLFVATMMVRTPSFRARFDESALPTLIEDMRGRLEERLAAGEIDPQTYKTLTDAFETPGHMKLDAPENRHVDVMVPLIAKVATPDGLRASQWARSFGHSAAGVTWPTSCAATASSLCSRWRSSARASERCAWSGVAAFAPRPRRGCERASPFKRPSIGPHPMSPVCTSGTSRATTWQTSKTTVRGRRSIPVAGRCEAVSLIDRVRHV